MENASSLIMQADRAYERTYPEDLSELVRMATSLPGYICNASASELPARKAVNLMSNEDMWSQFHSRQLPDTTRVRLEHFHLFEWFSLSPGRFHTNQGRMLRQEAESQLRRDSEGLFYNPHGKAHMVKGGIGAVKLRSRRLPNEHGQPEAHYFMTASSNGVCHEGVPVVIPRRLYADLITRLRQEGAVPVVLEGEMKQLPDSARSLFETWRLSHVPTLVIHIDRAEELAQPRGDVSRYTVAVVLSFYGQYQEQPGVYMSYCTLNPAHSSEREQKIDWLKRYVQRYEGQVITDFDEELPEFSNAPFALKRVMNGAIDPLRVEEVMNEVGYRYFGSDPDVVRQAVEKHNDLYLNLALLAQGDHVAGDKISVEHISSSQGIGIGRGAVASATTYQDGCDAETATAAFAQIHQAVNDSAATAAQKAVAQQAVERLEQEARKGEAADEAEVQQWFQVLATMLPDIAEVAIDTFLNPIKGVSPVFRNTAARAREQHGRI
jgi:hypothetical protein